MKKSKLNCWEYHKCGREIGGFKSQELGVCPVAVENSLEGIHNGKCAGRACWVVSGTMCGGEVQGTFAKKFNDCERCDFYKLVRTEEALNFNLAASILSFMRAQEWKKNKGILDNKKTSLCCSPDRKTSLQR